MSPKERPWLAKARAAVDIIEAETRKGATKLEAVEIAANKVDLGFSTLRNYVHAYEFIQTMRVTEDGRFFDSSAREEEFREVLLYSSVYFVNTLASLWKTNKGECIRFLEEGRIGDNHVKEFAQRIRNPRFEAEYPFFLETLHTYFFQTDFGPDRVRDFLKSHKRDSATPSIHAAAGQLWPGMGVTWLIENKKGDAELGRTPALMAVLEFNEQRVAESYTRSAKTLFARAALASCYADFVVVMAPVDLALSMTGRHWPTKEETTEAKEASFQPFIPASANDVPDTTIWKLRDCTGVILLTTPERFSADLAKVNEAFPNVLEKIKPVFDARDT